MLKISFKTKLAYWHKWSFKVEAPDMRDALFFLSFAIICYTVLQWTRFQVNLWGQSQAEFKTIMWLGSWAGRGCSTEVEHTTRNQEVVSLNLAGCWAIFSSLSFSVYLSLSISGVSFIRSLTEAQHYWFSWKNVCLRICAAWGKASLILTDWANKS